MDLWLLRVLVVWLVPFVRSVKFVGLVSFVGSSASLVWWLG